MWASAPTMAWRQFHAPTSKNNSFFRNLLWYTKVQAVNTKTRCDSFENDPQSHGAVVADRHAADPDGAGGAGCDLHR
jgi:hypothetical protein